MLEVYAAEASGMGLSFVNIVTALHRVAKTTATGSAFIREDLMLLLGRAQGHLEQARTLPESTALSAPSAASHLDDRALTTLAWSLGSLHQTLLEAQPRRSKVEQDGALAEQVRSSLEQIEVLCSSHATRRR